MFGIKQGKNIKLTKEQKIKCNSIIHGASVSAAGVAAGLAQIPLADNAIITPIQIAMIISLGIVFDAHIEATVATAILAGCAANVGGRAAAQVLVGWIPIVGNTVNASTAAFVTETIGWASVEIFRDKKVDEVVKNTDINTIKVDAKEIENAQKKLAQERLDELSKQVKDFMDGKKDIYRDDKDYDNLRKTLSDLYDEVKDKFTDIAAKIEKLKSDLLYLKKVE